MRKKSFFRRLLGFGFYVSSTFLLVLIMFLIWFEVDTSIKPPKVNNTSAWNQQRLALGNDFYLVESNWFKKNKYGLWEMYISGNPFELGAHSGNLSQELVKNQEDYFVASIKEMIPDEAYLKFLRYFIAIFNRDIDVYIPEWNKTEIYAISHYASDKYDFIGHNYERLLNYHAAHDIGHALQGMHMVGCSSFAVWGNKSEHNDLLIARNFDFYVGDDFAKDKIIEFIQPDTGIPFAMISWAGMTGTVSGMNREGLTVTLNAAKSEVPTKAKTPISLLSRNIIQFASNIDEAFKIAQEYQTFVSESIMIGSANDGKAYLIEKSPEKTVLYEEKQMQNQLICTNHYQSKEFSSDPHNVENIEKSDSPYRFNRLKQLLSQQSTINYRSAAQIMRNQKGINNEELGMGNQKAINQLIAHHTVIFEPAKQLIWVSTNPYQLGTFVCYDLNYVFDSCRVMTENRNVWVDSLQIAADSFLTSTSYANYEEFKKMKHQIATGLISGHLAEVDVAQLAQLNPQYYDAYLLAAKYCINHQDYEKAAQYLQTGLTKNIASVYEKDEMEQLQNECKSKLNGH